MTDSPLENTQVLPADTRLEEFVLKRKWKAHIRIETYKSQDRVSMDAPRRQSGGYIPIPDYAYDCHTPQGRKMGKVGKTKADFFKAEQEAFSPFIPGLFDNLIDS